MIPLLDLQAQHAAVQAELEEAVLAVLRSGRFVLGEEVVAFEEEFASYCDVRFGVGVNSGTSALHLALLAAGVGRDDEVITVPFTFVATVAAIDYIGAKPVLVDIDPKTFTMDPNAIEAAITPRTKAIVPVHLYGQPADMDPILEVAERFGVAVIEDAAQAHGAEYRGRRAGSLGQMGCFSFYPGKNLGACGEAGVVVTDNPEYARTLRMLRDWGAERKYEHVLKGFNYRMEAIQGAVLRVKLRELEQWTEQRRTAAREYAGLLPESGVGIPFVRDDVRHVYHVYAIRSPDRAHWRQHLSDDGIETGIHYPTPIHLLPAYSDLDHVEGDFPHAERAAREVLSLPMFPTLSADQCRTVAQSLAGLTRR